MNGIELNVTFDSGQDFAVGFEQEQDFGVEMDGILPGDYEGEYRFTPSSEAQTIPTAGKTLTLDIVVDPIPENYGLITWNGSSLTVS